MTCVHHYVLPGPDGPTCEGVCRNCGAVRTFFNSADGNVETSRKNMPACRLRAGAAIKAKKRGGAKTGAQHSAFYASLDESSLGKWA